MKQFHQPKRTTEAVRRAIQKSTGSSKELARKFGVNPKTVLKWKKRSETANRRPGPKFQQSSALSNEDERIIVGFRLFSLLPLDDCLYVLRTHIPNLSRSSLHRCLQRHGINRLPKKKKDCARQTQIGDLFIAIEKIHSTDGQLFVYGATDIGSQYIYSEIHPRLSPGTGEKFIRAIIGAFPFPIRKVLSPSHLQATFHSCQNDATNLFEDACQRVGIDHKYIADTFPWSHEESGGIIRDLPSQRHMRFQLKSHAELERDLTRFIVEFNFHRRLKTLRGLTPYQYARRYVRGDPLAQYNRLPRRIKRLIEPSIL